MPEPASPFEYAIVRVVPRVERGEAFNAGVVLFCRPHRFLGARVELDAAVLRGARARLRSGRRPGAPRRDRRGSRRATRPPGRSPRCPSRAIPLAGRAGVTIIQPSEVHTGLTDDPAAKLEHLFWTLVLR